MNNEDTRIDLWNYLLKLHEMKPSSGDPELMKPYKLEMKVQKQTLRNTWRAFKQRAWKTGIDTVKSTNERARALKP